jgi:NAD(P)-dependent dehydrogenase (short-subunit alcohol dehydrogenase family)
VQCAAAHGRVAYLELTAENVDRIHAINVRAPLLIGSAAGRAMVAAGIHGAIVNLTSISGVVSHAESVAYEASKGAVTMATRGMAVALAPHGIRVNAVGPGVMVKLQELDAVREPGDVDDYERQRIPLGRYGTPAEIAEVVMFLASPAAAYVTGQVLYADGGALAAWAAAGDTPAKEL